MDKLARCLLVYLFLSGTKAWSDPGICPVDSTDTHPVRKHGSRCYQFHMAESRVFDAAQSECRAHGGHEIVIRNADVQRFVYDVIEREFQYKGVVWIGLSDLASEGTFKWVDDSPLTFTFWARGQPNLLLGSVEDCVGMDMNDGGHWHDLRCEDFLFLKNPHPFICEFPLLFLGTTPTWAPAFTTTPPTTTTTTTTTTTAATVTEQTVTYEPTTASPLTLNMIRRYLRLQARNHH